MLLFEYGFSSNFKKNSYKQNVLRFNSIDFLLNKKEEKKKKEEKEEKNNFNRFV